MEKEVETEKQIANKIMYSIMRRKLDELMQSNLNIVYSIAFYENISITPEIIIKDGKK